MVLIPKGSWFFKCFLLGVCPDYRAQNFSWRSKFCAPNHQTACVQGLESELQASKGISLWISSFYCLCLWETSVPHTSCWLQMPAGAQTSSCFAMLSLKAFQKSSKSSADGFLSPQKPRIHLQRVLQTCCGHQPAVCRRELFNGHFSAVRGHQNM